MADNVEAIQKSIKWYLIIGAALLIALAASRCGLSYR
jgi:hypothetical protein